MTIHVLYHNNCFDGAGAAAAVYEKFEESAQYYPMDYYPTTEDNIEDLPFAAQPDDQVIMVDYSLPRGMVANLNAADVFVQLIDHHQTAQDALADYTHPNYHVVFDMTKSGAVLAWEFLFPDTATPHVLLYIQDGDLWRWGLRNTREVRAAIRSWEKTPQSYHKLLKHSIEELIGNGRILIEAEDRYIKDTADVATMAEVGGHRVPLVNSTTLFSEVGHELCTRYPEAPFAAYYTVLGSRVKFGLRGRDSDDFDVSSVAKQYRGGGHKKAAGFWGDLSLLRGMCGE